MNYGTFENEVVRKALHTQTFKSQLRRSDIFALVFSITL